MSWDVYLMKVPDELVSIDELSADFDPAHLGTREQVHAALRSAVPGIGPGEPAWRTVIGPTWSIELNIGESDPVRSIMLHIRGGGDDVVPMVLTIARALGCDALDLMTGEVMRSPDTRGWHEFQAYRDQIMQSDQ